MICRWCGKEVFPGQRNCGGCGREVPPLSDCGGFYQVVPDAAQQERTSFFQQPPKQMLQPSEHGGSGGGGKNWKALFAAVGILGLLLVLFAILNGRISKIARQIEVLQKAVSDQAAETAEDTATWTETATISTTEAEESSETVCTSAVEAEEPEKLPTVSSTVTSEAGQEFY